MASLQILLLSLCIVTTVGKAVNLQKRIYGGTKCLNTERKYHVKLIPNDGSENYLCGGSLISDRWILTAAHCWKHGWTMRAVLGVHPGPGEEVQIKRMVPYQDEKKKTHDIMLLLLPKPTTIAPVTLPNCEVKRDIDIVQVAGHGNFQIDATTKKKLPGSPPELRCANMNIVDCSRFKDSRQSCRPNEPFENWLCAEGNEVDTCGGDSGGGVVYSKSDVTLIYGVISNGPTCACAEPAAFLKVCPYMKWIRETIAQKS